MTGPPSPREVGPIEVLTRSALRRGLPFVVRGLARGWPASRWTQSELRKRFGASEVTSYRIEKGELRFDRKTGLIPERLPLAQALDRAATHRVRSRIEDELPALAREVRVPEACEGRLRLELNLWISGARVRSRLHYDQPENLLVQIEGTKRVTLFAPSQAKFLYPNPITSTIAQFSRVDLAAPDASRFPRLARAQAWRTTIAPADAVFIPGRWWHYVEADEPTISLGIRWWRARHLPRLIAADLYKRLRGQVR